MLTDIPADIGGDEEDEPAEALPRLLEDLTEEEAYLVAILTDVAGIDIAEYAFVDEEQDDGCYRAYPFQHCWWRNSDEQQIEQGARSTGKCLAGSTLVLLADGTEWPIASLVGHTPELAGYDTLLRASTGKALSIFASGRKPVSIVATRMGKEIKATDAHRFLTFNGWRRLDQLQVGDAIATAGRITPSTSQSLSGREVVLLALMIADGGCTQGTPKYNKGDPALVEDLRWAVEAFPGMKVEAMWVPKKNAWECVIGQKEPAFRDDGHYAENPVHRWMGSFDLAGKKSTEKTIPEAIMRSPDHQVALFLGRLVSGDGCVEDSCISYASSSPPLTLQVQQLLRRFGIVSTRRTKWNTAVRGGPKFQSWEIRIPTSEIRRFAEVVGPYIVGFKALDLVDTLSRLNDRPKPFLDRIPDAVWPEVRRAWDDASLKRCDLKLLANRSSAQGIGRDRLTTIAEMCGSDLLAMHASSHVCWDRVDAITPAGETATYDITMAGEPNFIADSFVVHNSEGIKNAACAVPFNYPGEEHVITAPENKHVERLTDRIEEQILSTRLLREMVVGGKSGINHRPFFKVRWKTGARLITVIPQISGQGLKGIHPAKLDIDEAQNFPPQGWKEVRETLKKHVKNAMWRIHGVTTGIPDDFHKMTQPEVPFSIRPYRSSMGFTVHRITAYHKPTWTQQELEDKLAQYGSRNAPEFRRNVLGMHGDAANPIFVTNRLLGNTDTNEGSEYNQENYWKKEVRFEQIEDLAARQNLGPEDYGRLLVDMLDFPAEHRRYEVFWAGMDVGIARDPSEVVVFGEYVPKAAERRQDERNGIAVPLEGDTRLRLLTRFHMLRFPTTVQVEALMAIVNHYRPRAMSLDATGNGLGLLQQLQQLAQRSRIMRIEIEPEDDDEEAQAVAKTLREAAKKEPAGQALTVIKGYNFGGKVVVEIDEEKAAELPAAVKPDELAEKAGIKRLVKEYATDKCRDLVDAKRLMLPYDENLLAQMNGQTWVYSSQPTDAYGNRRRTYSRGEFHCLVGDTIVTTSRGPVTIDRVLVGDMVLTRAGWRPVLDAWMARPDAAVVRAVMGSGSQLVGTADHRVWTTQHGWVPLGELERGMECVAADETSTNADPVVTVEAGPPALPVYDLTVEQDHEFLANGLVVSNCFDAIRMAVLGYSLQPIEQLLKAPPKKRAPVYDRFL